MKLSADGKTERIMTHDGGIETPFCTSMEVSWLLARAVCRGGREEWQSHPGGNDAVFEILDEENCKVCAFDEGIHDVCKRIKEAQKGIGLGKIRSLAVNTRPSDETGRHYFSVMYDIMKAAVPGTAPGSDVEHMAAEGLMATPDSRAREEGSGEDADNKEQPQ